MALIVQRGSRSCGADDPRGISASDADTVKVATLVSTLLKIATDPSGESSLLAGS
jgi:hypothetical protein